MPAESEDSADGAGEGASDEVGPVGSGAGSELGEGGEPGGMDIGLRGFVAPFPKVIPPADLVNGGPYARVEKGGGDERRKGSGADEA